MATSRKTPNSVRQGGPGASHENAREPLRMNKPTADDPKRRHSRVSGGGGEHDSHHTHQPAQKGGGSHPADKE
jgi:hypothetical protein